MRLRILQADASGALRQFLKVSKVLKKPFLDMLVVQKKTLHINKWVPDSHHMLRRFKDNFTRKEYNFQPLSQRFFGLLIRRPKRESVVLGKRGDLGGGRSI